MEIITYLIEILDPFGQPICSMSFYTGTEPELDPFYALMTGNAPMKEFTLPIMNPNRPAIPFQIRISKK